MKYTSEQIILMCIRENAADYAAAGLPDPHIVGVVGADGENSFCMECEQPFHEAS